MFLFWILRLCVISLLINAMQGYVLFAANLDDFRSIAKKFIPQKLADQLAEMASETSAKYHQKAEEKDSEYETNESEGDGDTKPSIDNPKNNVKKRYVVKNPMPQVNIDELVEKVRERLLIENKANKSFGNVQKTKHTNKNVGNTDKAPNDDEAGNVDGNQNDYENNADYNDPSEKYYEEVTTKRQKPQTKAKIQTDGGIDNKEEIDYPESVKVDRPPNQDGGDGKIFHGFDLQNANDSYEDYVTPDKGKIFESEELKTTKLTTLRPKTFKKVSEKTIPKNVDDVRARTESLVYDEREVRANRTKDGVLRKQKNVRKGKGTMIPTRQYYKMSSPDYYKKLPVIAEKYNFDEPLPEKDREPENFKPIGNPPAKINKKVRV